VVTSQIPATCYLECEFVSPDAGVGRPGCSTLPYFTRTDARVCRPPKPPSIALRPMARLRLSPDSLRQPAVRGHSAACVGTLHQHTKTESAGWLTHISSPADLSCPGQAGDPSTWLERLNELRAAFATLRPEPPATLAALQDPITAAGPHRSHVSERARWLFATGHRLGDLWSSDPRVPTGGRRCFRRESTSRAARTGPT
jgi:hypothetical protein